MRVAVVDPACFSMPYDHGLCEGLRRQGCEVLFVGSRSRYAPWVWSSSYARWDHFYRLTHRIYPNPSGGVQRWVKGVEHMLDMERLVHRLRKWHPDIIHFQWLPLPPVDRLFLPRLRKEAPLVLTVHDTQPFQGSPSSRFQLWKLYEALRLFDHYIVHTRFSRDALVDATGLPETRVSVIPHGVLDYYGRESRSFPGAIARETPHRPKTLLFFGVIKPYKGLDLLIEAFARLPQELRRETWLLIVGYPKMPVKPLQELAQRLGIGDRTVWDLRFIPEEEVASVFEQASAVVLPYRRVDQSSVLMTALAFGKPVVATRVGGFAETLENGVHGFLVEPGDVDGLAKALEALLSDPESVRRMGHAVRALSQGELSWDTVAQRTVQLYRGLCRA